MGALIVPTILRFNGKELDPKVFKVEHLPDYTIPQRDVQTIHVEGRSGDILIDSGSYKNITRSYNISFGAAGPYDFAAKVSEISKWLDCEGYCELHDTYENDYYRLAFPSGSYKVSSILNGRAGKVTVDFSCIPKRFLNYGKDGFEWHYTNNSDGAAYRPGDVDGDGKITLVDADLALKAAVGLVTLEGAALNAANMDGDVDPDTNVPIITAADARLILRLWDKENSNAFLLWNPTPYDCKPVIECDTNASGISKIYIAPKFKSELSDIASVEVDLTGDDVKNVRHFVVDCDRETVYEAGTYKNLNHVTTVSKEFPTLIAQTDNRVEFTGAIREIRVFPNYWVR